MDSFQRRHSYQLRVWQFKSAAELAVAANNSNKNDDDLLDKFTSHSKLLKQIRFNTDSFRILTILNEIPSINSITTTTVINNNNNNNKSSNLINLMCQINPSQLKQSSQFKFSLKISQTDNTIGDLRAILREILLRILKSTNPESASTSYSFVNNQLMSVINSSSSSSTSQLLFLSEATNNEMLKSLIENEDDFYIKIFIYGSPALI